MNNDAKTHSRPNAQVAPVAQRYVFLFLGNCRIVVRRGLERLWQPFGLGRNGVENAAAHLERLGFAEQPVKVAEVEDAELYFVVLDGMEIPRALMKEGYSSIPLWRFYENTDLLRPVLEALKANAIRIPYLYLNANDYIYRFRAESERNRQVYQSDDTSVALYHSALCDAIKAVKRAKERSATSPARLDFGATEFLLPSHFGFCLGVQNAIERAYETLAANPDKRVFMLSELIHNPFVNEDLKARGLRYLQSDKGVPLLDERSGSPYWDSLGEDDIVIIPAFGARDEDKLRLIERGLPIRQYDATCMLVEKVWKAARRYGQQGYTIIIHGKAEHEETKATFSNSAKHAPSLVIRDMKEAAALGDVIYADDPEEKRRLFEPFREKATAGFDPQTDLQRLALVNQTTLLRNETLKIIAFLEQVLCKKYGEAHVTEHLAMSSKGDTLCYATQVNQDALARALDEEIDAAIVVGGKNSSNTYQLFRLCQDRFGDRAFYIQSESNILSKEEIEHFIFPYDPNDPKQGIMETRRFLPDQESVRILVTGGASCPDGILQQIICRINGFFPQERIRSVESVLAELE
ncbi:4-hydroxy-3-methylbut-2-enyl diphosphate reductase [Pelagicoccus sp. SDUM812003]|uniref:4-hydroxy-3-methylbut-2-enyl diphosphate reductase n=1 Tax=Pelagicoccus sp. SDUM812003 TaxID=3041267 RepID=UPI00280D2F0B|nr:4-hydroxy-3-methylbut-2-enyl diphosphate reductase [Pelagicoccus sp. SDUM812003]MDQ8202770.1 4-hydroxy-3-methylbut-2-enyl diphosphate reductase [Pelagicoccus sp. SDUM812003]